MYDPIVHVLDEFVNDDIAGVRLELILYSPNGDEIILFAEGVAKRDPIDKPNQDTAFKLAYARAFEKLAARLNRQAWGQIKHTDDVRESKEQMKSLWTTVASYKVNDVSGDASITLNPVQQLRLFR